MKNKAPLKAVYSRMQDHEHDQHKNQVLCLHRKKKQELLWIFLGSAPAEEQSQQNSLRKMNSAFCCCFYIYFLSLCCPLNNQETSFRELLLPEKQRPFVSRVPGVFFHFFTLYTPREIVTLMLVSLCISLSFHHSYISIFRPSNKRCGLCQLSPPSSSILTVLTTAKSNHR